jgi:lysine 6-dehydrogenase
MNQSGRPLTFAVLGGAGAMGRITVRDLIETTPLGTEVLIADYNLPAAKKLAREMGPKARAIKVDVTQVGATAKALKGVFAVVNACRHDFNVGIMKAALTAKVHYCDLGGLFHETKKQLKLNAQFKKAGLIALCGIGAAPGVVNVLARAAADEMERVDEIHVAVGNVDRTPGRGPTALGTSYSILTILDEASMPAALFTDGKFTLVEPMTGDDPVDFPAPVGRRRPARTIHSEVATLPLSYKSKGVREVSFRIAFSDELDGRLRFLHALGLTSTKPVKVGKSQVVPRDVLLALLAKQPKADAGGVPDEYEVLRVIVRGLRGGHKVEEVLDCHCPGIPKWHLGVDVDTGCPPSIFVQMLARGEIAARGVLPPEVAIPAEPFFRELIARGMTIQKPRPPVGASSLSIGN